MIDASLVYMVLAGVSFGVTFGLSDVTITDTERRNNIRTKRLFGGFFPVFALFIAGAAIAFGILQSGDVYPLSQKERHTLTVSWFASIACVKFLRYWYWKGRS